MSRVLRVGILVQGALEKQDSFIQVNLLRILMQCKSDGHDAFLVATPSDKSRHATGFLDKLVGDAEADAWLVSVPSVEILRWFLEKGIPILAMGGRTTDLPVASVTFSAERSLRELVCRLTRAGHRRIVLIISGNSRHPTPSPLLLAYLDELKRNGITPGEYNAPEWDETPAGLETLLDSLFRVTSPTALICWHRHVTVGVLSFIERRRLAVPGDVSLFCCDEDPSLAWHRSEMKLGHFAYDETPRLRFIRRWLEDVAAGRPHVRRLELDAELREGTTLGPAKK